VNKSSDSVIEVRLTEREREIDRQTDKGVEQTDRKADLGTQRDELTRQSSKQYIIMYVSICQTLYLRVYVSVCLGACVCLFV